MAGLLSYWPRQPEAQGLLLPEGGDTVLLSLQVSYCLFVFSAKQLGIPFWQWRVGRLFLARIHRLA